MLEIGIQKYSKEVFLRTPNGLRPFNPFKRFLREDKVKLGKVIGTVWSTKKDENLVGMKFLIVRDLNLDYSEKNSFTVAVDSVGAGVGEIVLYASGSSARQTVLTKNRPVDSVIMAIVDKLDVSVELALKEEI